MTDFEVPEPILNSPFEGPAEHWEITPQGLFPAGVAFDGPNVWVVVTNDNGVRKH